MIHFCDTNIKMNAKVYRAMLNDVLPHLEEIVFVDEDKWCFQQDSVPTHKVKKKCKYDGKSMPVSLKRMTSPH